jgi:hypothetical protein
MLYFKASNPMLKKILLVIAVLLVVLVVVIQMQPNTFLVKRSTTVNAPPEKVFAQVNDFHKWDAWSPWVKLDPNMKATFSGPDAGTGAIYSWTGNDKVGEGRMTMTSSEPTTHVGIKLEFLKPFASTSQTDFNFAPQAGTTTVTWSMSGENNFLSKAMCLVMGGMDKMVGPDFEKGLAAMKTAAEGR